MKYLLTLSTILLILPLCARADDAAKNPHARWEPAIQRFEDLDREESRPRNAVLFVGSSSIVLWDVPRSFPELAAINHGFGGSQIDDTIHFADRIVWPFQPRTIVFYAGDNDVAGGKSAEEVAADYACFSKMVHEQLPETHLIYVAIKPSTRRWHLADEIRKANDRIQQLCEDDDQRSFLDIWTPMLGEDGKPKSDWFIKDGLHLNQAGYDLWNGLLQKEFDRLDRPELKLPVTN